MQPVVVIGDVHGRADLLRNILAKIRGRFGQDVDIYQTGDLIDRGPHGSQVIDLCLKNNIKPVIGNHEIWLHRYLATGVFDQFALNSRMEGAATLRSYGLDSTDPEEIAVHLHSLIPQEHKDFILELPVWRDFEVGGRRYRLCHSGLKKEHGNILMGEVTSAKPDLPVEKKCDLLCETVEEIKPALVIWVGTNYKDPQLYHFPDGSCQVFGHSPCGAQPAVTHHWIALDTGCGTRPPQTLSAIILPDREIIQVSSLTGKIKETGFTDFMMDGR